METIYQGIENTLSKARKDGFVRNFVAVEENIRSLETNRIYERKDSGFRVERLEPFPEACLYLIVTDDGNKGILFLTPNTETD